LTACTPPLCLWVPLLFPFVNCFPPPPKVFSDGIFFQNKGVFLFRRAGRYFFSPPRFHFFKLPFPLQIAGASLSHQPFFPQPLFKDPHNQNSCPGALKKTSPRKFPFISKSFPFFFFKSHKFLGTRYVSFSPLTHFAFFPDED